MNLPTEVNFGIPSTEIRFSDSENILTIKSNFYIFGEFLVLFMVN